MNNKMEDFLTATKLNELIHKKEIEEKNKNTVLWILAVIAPSYLDEFEDDFDDDEFDDDFFDDEEE